MPSLRDCDTDSQNLLARLGSDKSLIIWTWKRDHLDRVRQSAVECVGQGDRESGREKIDIDLKIALRAKPMNHHHAAAAVG